MHAMSLYWLHMSPRRDLSAPDAFVLGTSALNSEAGLCYFLFSVCPIGFPYQEKTLNFSSSAEMPITGSSLSQQGWLAPPTFPGSTVSCVEWHPATHLLEHDTFQELW